MFEKILKLGSRSAFSMRLYNHVDDVGDDDDDDDDDDADEDDDDDDDDDADLS